MKLTALEKKWVLYDVANSAFTLMVSTLIPIYFHSLAKEAGIKSSTYLATWGYAISLSTLLVVLIGPIIGAYSDKQGHCWGFISCHASWPNKAMDGLLGRLYGCEGFLSA